MKKVVIFLLAIFAICQFANAQVSNSAKTSNDTLLITVDYGKTVDEMVSAGKYVQFNPDVNSENFPLPIEKVGKKEILSVKLFHFNHSVSSKNIARGMSKKGFRPATVAEILAFGATYPELQKQNPIAATGSVFGWFVPCLYSIGNERRLGLDLNVGRWLPSFHYCFLGVYK